MQIGHERGERVLSSGVSRALSLAPAYGRASVPKPWGPSHAADRTAACGGIVMREAEIARSIRQVLTDLSVEAGCRLWTRVAGRSGRDPRCAGRCRCTCRVVSCTLATMERVNVTLEDEHAQKLVRLAERMHVQPGTVARSLLAQALDDADPDPRNVVALLDGIDGAYDRAQLGLQQAQSGQTVSVDEL